MSEDIFNCSYEEFNRRMREANERHLETIKEWKKNDENCKRRVRTEYHREWYAKNKEKSRETNRRYMESLTPEQKELRKRKNKFAYIKRRVNKKLLVIWRREKYFEQRQVNKLCQRTLSCVGTHQTS